MKIEIINIYLSLIIIVNNPISPPIISKSLSSYNPSSNLTKSRRTPSIKFSAGFHDHSPRIDFKRKRT